VPLIAVDVPPPAGTEGAVKLLIGNSNASPVLEAMNTEVLDPA
jgi:hypothetical protein